MAYKVAIKNNATGEVRIHQEDADWEENQNTGYTTAFWWQEGNGACDCNRAAFWLASDKGDEEVPHPVDLPCGDTRFSVLYAELPNGRRIDL